MLDEKKKNLIRCLNRAFKLTKIKQRLEREYKQKLKEVDIISVPCEEIKASRITSKVENKALDLVSLKKDIDLHNFKIEEVKMEISCVIDKLEDDTLKTLLRLRYLEFRKWGDIMYILHYSRRNVFYRHNEALKEIAKLNNI
ncbi:DUF1492 domain-containing protein [uncultured Tyzzerella sp.]|uniref:DUF1492 domain-containing protein n=1 Tax=uncultured Tyzzerella sp. TaxID=2321398 RepID=UPI002942AE46|nr:DUF1492 domain-containing protein [uncultured Tyzzerella sp.]